MTCDLVMSLIFMWLLTASGHNDNVTTTTTQETEQTTSEQTTREQTTREQTTREQASSLTPGHNVTQSITAEGNRTEPSLLTSSPPINTAASPTISTLPQFNITSTTEQFNATTSARTAVTTHSSISTTTWLPSTLSSSTHEQMTSLFTAQSTELTSTATTSTQPADTSSVTGEDTTLSTGSSLTTTKTPLIPITEGKRRDPQENESSNGISHGKVVAGLIGGALVLMMAGFLLIYIKKRNLHRQQLTTTDWAGPSPFLEGGADNSQVTLRSTNLISLSSFLPQRLSKRLSLLPDIDEELEDRKHEATTFGDKRNGSTFSREPDGNDRKESDEAAAGVNADEKTTRDDPVTSSPNNNAEVSNQVQKHPADPSTPSGAVENALNDNSGQPLDVSTVTGF